MFSLALIETSRYKMVYIYVYFSRVTQSKNSTFENRVDIETARKDVSQVQKQLQGLLHTNQMFEFPTSLTSSPHFRSL